MPRYGNVESLRGTPETSIILYARYTWMRKRVFNTFLMAKTRECLHGHTHFFPAGENCRRGSAEKQLRVPRRPLRSSPNSTRRPHPQNAVFLFSYAPNPALPSSPLPHATQNTREHVGRCRMSGETAQGELRNSLCEKHLLLKVKGNESLLSNFKYQKMKRLRILFTANI